MYFFTPLGILPENGVSDNHFLPPPAPGTFREVEAEGDAYAAAIKRVEAHLSLFASCNAVAYALSITRRRTLPYLSIDAALA